MIHARVQNYKKYDDNTIFFLQLHTYVAFKLLWTKTFRVTAAQI